MAKVYYCEECKKRFDWPARRGRKKLTRCSFCKESEPVECYSGDSAQLRAAEAPEPKTLTTGPHLAKFDAKGAIEKKRAERRLSKGSEGGGPKGPLEIEEVSALPKVKGPDLLSLDADALRKKSDEAEAAEVNKALVTILKVAMQVANEGKERSFSVGQETDLNSKVKKALEDKGFVVEKKGASFKISW